MEKARLRKYLVEFIGTFYLVLTIIVAVGGTSAELAVLAIGLMLIALIYAGGHISRAHYNPAVTFAFWLRKQCDAVDIPGYVIAQLAAAALAVFAGQYLVGNIQNASGLQLGAPLDLASGTLAEFLGTFILVFVILNVATTKSLAGNSFYGLAIGFTVIGAAYTIGGVTGGAFNPAVAFSLMLAGISDWSNAAIFLGGQLLAALLAAISVNIVAE